MYYGLDIGGTKIEIAIFDSSLSLTHRWRVSTPSADYGVFIDTLVQLVTEADALSADGKSPQEHVPGTVGIGLPGLVTPNGISLCANVPCANGQTVQQDLAERLKRPVFSENDTRCFALSEARLGEGKGYARVYGAILGTGAAGGLCIHQQLDSGPNHFSGEYGHIPLPAFLQAKYDLPARPCGCGLQDCMEQYIAGPGLGRLYDFFRQDTQVLTAPECIQALRHNEPVANQTFTCYMDLLGYSFANIILQHDPHIIVIGGGLSKVSEIIHGLPAAITPYLFNGTALPIIRPAQFGDSSGVRGAAMLGVKHNV